MKSMCIPGCVFEHFGKVPENVYQADKFNSPFEEAVFKDDKETFHNLAKVKVGRDLVLICPCSLEFCIQLNNL